MQTKNEIIENLFRSKQFNDCINKMHPEHLRDDLRSDVMLILLETDDAKILDMSDRKQLTFYTVRIILNLIRSQTSPFFKTYRQFNPIDIEIPDTGFSEEENAEELAQRQKREETEDKAVEILEGMDFYPQEITKLYLKLGSFRKIEKETYHPGFGQGIAWESCYTTVKKTFKQIKNALING